MKSCLLYTSQFIPEIIRFGELKIYLQERIVKKNDSDVHLSKYEYDILLFLAKSPGRIFGKEMVYDQMCIRDRSFDSESG